MSAAPPIGQLLGESAVLTLRAFNVWRARHGGGDVHPGNERLSETRAEWSGYRPNRSTTGRHMRRLWDAGCIERISHGGGKEGGGRAADVWRMTSRGMRAINGYGDHKDAVAVARIVPRRYLVRFASTLNGRAAWLQCLGERLAGPLRDAVEAAHAAATARAEREQKGSQALLEAPVVDATEYETLPPEPAPAPSPPGTIAHRAWSPPPEPSPIPADVRTHLRSLGLLGRK